MINLIPEVAEPSRRSILAELMTGPKCVNVLVEKTGLKQPNVSNHLARLRCKGLVKTSKIGRQVIYRLATPEIQTKLQAIFARNDGEPAPVSVNIEIAEQFARLACAGNEHGCAGIVDKLIENHISVDRIYRELFAPAMRFVGNWFQTEAIDVGQEHLASALTEHMMSRVMHYSAPKGRSKVRALLAGVAGDYHSIGIRMAADVIKDAGGVSIYLGANVPSSCIAKALETHKPNLVLLGCSIQEVVPEAISVIRQLLTQRKSWECFAIGVGGYAAKENSSEFLNSGADFVAMSLDCLIENVLPAIESRVCEPKGVLGASEP